MEERGGEGMEGRGGEGTEGRGEGEWREFKGRRWSGMGGEWRGKRQERG